MKNHIKKALSKLNVYIGRKNAYIELHNKAIEFDRIQIYRELLGSLEANRAKRVFPYIFDSESQLGQDLFVLAQLDLKNNGYFVEFGAANGKALSNTYLLEKRFDWKGIIAEPARVWHKEIQENRSCHFEKDCVWTNSMSVFDFNETDTAELSTIDTFTKCDEHANARKSGKKYKVNTISLLDLLKKYDAPKNIDYLSIDTEGSEFEILSAFDFSQYSFEIITCEHNFTPNRQKVKSLLLANGYQQVFEKISKWDDWYVKTK